MHVHMCKLKKDLQQRYEQNKRKTSKKEKELNYLCVSFVCLVWSYWNAAGSVKSTSTNRAISKRYMYQEHFFMEI